MPDLDQRRAEPGVSGMFEDAMQVFAPHDNTRAKEALGGVEPEGPGMFGQALAALAAPEPTLREGDSGAEVWWLQELLNERGMIVEVDGEFGGYTKSAVAGFQGDRGLKADGVYGPDTAQAIAVRPKDPPPPAPPTGPYRWDTGGVTDPSKNAFDERAHAANQDATNHGSVDPSLNETGGGTPGIKVPLRDVIYEQLAHRSAYLHFPAELMADKKATIADKANSIHTDDWAPEYNSREKDWINALGYSVVKVVDDPKTGFQAVLFALTADGVWVDDKGHFAQLNEGLMPVVAFRGSQSTASWNDDANPEGAGAMQFRLNEAKITALLAEGGAMSKMGAPDVVGHSLGGGLAQMAAAHYPGMVNDVITFQAVGLSGKDADYAKTARNQDVTHYRVKGDLVPIGGEAFLDAKVVDMEMGNTQDMADAHTSYPLASAHAGMAAWDDPHLHMLSADPEMAHAEDTYVGQGPSAGRGVDFVRNTGINESIREVGIGTQRAWDDASHLTGPITRLAEQLRGLVREWHGTGIACEAMHAKIRSYVDARQDELCEGALKAKYGGRENRPEIRDALRTKCRELSDALSDETCALYDQQVGGKINRNGWKDW